MQVPGGALTAALNVDGGYLPHELGHVLIDHWVGVVHGQRGACGDQALPFEQRCHRVRRKLIISGFRTPNTPPAPQALIMGNRM